MISAEGSDRTDLVLDLYEQLVVEFPHVGITVQARLHRTPADLDRLLGRWCELCGDSVPLSEIDGDALLRRRPRRSAIPRTVTSRDGNQVRATVSSGTAANTPGARRCPYRSSVQNIHDVRDAADVGAQPGPREGLDDHDSLPDSRGRQSTRRVSRAMPGRRDDRQRRWVLEQARAVPCQQRAPLLFV